MSVPHIWKDPQASMSEPLEQELQMAENYKVGARNQTKPGFSAEQVL